MIHLIVDVNVLVGISPRPWAQRLLSDPGLDLWMTARATGEAAHEFDGRLQALLDRNLIGPLARISAPNTLHRLMEEYVTVVPDDVSLGSAAHEAALRVPDDPDDQPTAARAMGTDGAIWTEDRHFWGCGLPVWRTDRLRAVMDNGP